MQHDCQFEEEHEQHEQTYIWEGVAGELVSLIRVIVNIMGIELIRSQYHIIQI